MRSEIETKNTSISGQDSDSSTDNDELSESSDSDDSLEPDFGNLRLSDDSPVAVSYLNTHSPYLLLESSLLPSEKSQVFGIHKALFLEDELADPSRAISSWNRSISSSGADKEDNGGKISALFMMGGGHFAGAIVSHTRLNVVGNVRKENQTLQEQAVRLIEHKTFHRYTTRRKQGGTQSAMDNAKGKANSAGSSLRRYNEAALKNDVTELLKLWKPYLDRCSLIFIRARNAHDRSVFFADNLLQKTDPRLRTFPFTTGRPTTGELRRSWCELTYMKIVDRPTPFQAKPSGVSSTTAETDKVRETEVEPVKVATFTPEERHTEEIVRLLKKGRAPFLMAYLKKNQLQADFKFMPEGKYATTPTMLHYASQQGLKQMVLILLTKLKCSPTVKNVNGKTPWDLAKSDAVRQSFQVARYTLGEDYVSWDEARVGKPMSKEEVESLNAAGGDKQAEEVTTAIMQELEAARERRKEEREQKKKSSGSNGSSRLGTGNSQSPILTSITQNLNSLTDEQRRRLMREQRARAAEARMRKQSQSQSP